MTANPPAQGDIPTYETSTVQPGFTMTFTVDANATNVFEAINDVRAWWTADVADNIEGDTRRLGDTFTYRYGDVHRSTQRITESLPGKRVVWHVDDAELAFTQDPGEWIGTDIVFDITSVDAGSTEVRFTHVGLVPKVECFGACSTAWATYVGGNLKRFIESR